MMIARSLLVALLVASSTAAVAQYAPDGYGAPQGYPQEGDQRDAYPPQGYDQQGDYPEGQQIGAVGDFYGPLARYGRWVNSRWGRAWSPNVDRDWRPYTIGRWEDSDEFGRTWRSDEPFGWATYHYGRWGFDQQLGWLWVPDTVWGPGWVAWRDGGDYAGWAPLPPQVSISFGIGSGFNDWGYDRWYQPSWVFVPRGYLYGRSLRGAILPYQRNREWYGRTRGITHYERYNGRVINRSFAFVPRRDGRDHDRPGYGVAPGGRPVINRNDGVRPGYDPRNNGVRFDGNRFDSNRPGYARPEGGRPGYDRDRAAVNGGQGFRDRNNDGIADRSQRPAVTDGGNRPGWERRREQAFQPATGGAVSPPVPAQVQVDRGGNRGQYNRRDGGAPGNGFGNRGGNRAVMPAPAVAVARPQASPPQAPPPQAAPVAVVRPTPPPPAERQRGEGARGGQRGDRGQDPR